MPRFSQSWGFKFEKVLDNLGRFLDFFSGEKVKGAEILISAPFTLFKLSTDVKAVSIARFGYARSTTIGRRLTL